MTASLLNMPLSAGFLDRRPPGESRACLGFYKGRALTKGEAAVWVDPDDRGIAAYLGTLNGKSIFAQDLSHLEDLPGEPTDLWMLPKDFPTEDLALACQGQHVLRWHARHPLCAKCGTPTEVKDWGRQRHCPVCATDFYPRTDPAVIMLVQSPDLQRVVLAHTKVMPPGLHSLLAGYVEPGETLEDTVRRETFEEAGLHVIDVRYVASQPWALSGSLMCGFTCVAESEKINIDPEELETADWYSREDLRRLKSDPGFIYPRRNTIARHLLDRWMIS